MVRDSAPAAVLIQMSLCSSSDLVTASVSIAISTSSRICMAIKGIEHSLSELGWIIPYLLGGCYNWKWLALLLFTFGKAAEPQCITGGFCCLRHNPQDSMHLCPELVWLHAAGALSGALTDIPLSNPNFVLQKGDQCHQKLRANRCWLAFATLPFRCS